MGLCITAKPGSKSHLGIAGLGCDLPPRPGQLVMRSGIIGMAIGVAVLMDAILMDAIHAASALTAARQRSDYPCVILHMPLQVIVICKRLQVGLHLQGKHMSDFSLPL